MSYLTFISWTGTARLVRGQILYLREQEYIVACEVIEYFSAEGESVYHAAQKFTKMMCDTPVMPKTHHLHGEVKKVSLLKYKPFLIKPNIDELEALFDCKVQDKEHLISLMKSLQQLAR